MNLINDFGPGGANKQKLVTTCENICFSFGRSIFAVEANISQTNSYKFEVEGAVGAICANLKSLGGRILVP